MIVKLDKGKETIKELQNQFIDGGVCCKPVPVCKTYIDWFAITFALTLTSCPIISLPVGFSSHGLPVGIQIMSKPRQEDKLLAFAKVLEEKVSVNKNSPI